MKFTCRKLQLLSTLKRIMTKSKILIIEDEREVCNMLARILTRHGYEATAAYDGLEGLDKVKSFNPSLVLLDVFIPRIDGLQVLKRLKASPETSHIPVVMCTARALMSEVEEAIGMGASGYIVKPFLTEEVIDKLKEILEAPKVP